MADAPITVWQVPLDDAPATGDRLLSDGERSRAERFHSQVHRDRFVASRAALRTVLGSEAGIAARDITLRTSAYGKPYLASNPQIRFSISRAGDCALIAVSDAADVGVDIAIIDATVDVAALARDVLSRAELGELDSVQPEMRTAAFFSAWTRKEAYLKGRGDGIALGLDHFDVSLSPGQPATLRTDRRDPEAASQWTLLALPVPAGFAGALAVRASALRLSFRDFRWPSSDRAMPKWHTPAARPLL